MLCTFSFTSTVLKNWDRVGCGMDGPGFDSQLCEEIFIFSKSSSQPLSINKMKLNIYSIFHNCMFILLLFLLLPTSFGLKRPSSGQYLPKPWNSGAYNTNTSVLWDPIYIHVQPLQLLPAFRYAVCGTLCWEFIFWVLWTYFQNFHSLTAIWCV